MEKSQLPPIMSVEQAARFLCVSRATAYNWCTKGEMPSFKVGNTRRINRESFLQWLIKIENEVGVSN